MYSVKTFQGQPARFSIASRLSLTGYTFTVQTSATEAYTTTFERGQATLNGNTVDISWSAAEVDEITDRYFRIQAVKSGSPTFFLTSGKLEYTPTAAEVTAGMIDSNGYLVEPNTALVVQNSKLASANDIVTVNASIAGITSDLTTNYRKYKGVGATYPSTVVDGDYMFRNDLGCMMIRVGSTWRQLDKPQLANAAAIAALPTAALYNGFEAWATDLNRQWRWTGTKWQFIGGNIPAIMVRRTTSFTSVANTWTPLTWESVVTAETTDTVMWSAANPTRFTAPFDGIYNCFTAVGFGSNLSYKYLAIRKSTGAVMYRGPANNSTNPEQQAQTTLKLLSGEYVEMMYYNQSAETMNQYSAEVAPRAEFRWVGAA